MKPVQILFEVETVDDVKLSDARQDLFLLFQFHVAFLRARSATRRLTISVTSVLRPDDRHSVHAYGRGLDYTIDGIMLPEVITVLMQLREITNLMFPYVSQSGVPGTCCVYRMRTRSRGTDPSHKRHVHLQVPSEGWANG